jgi:hypothetical protein
LEESGALANPGRCSDASIPANPGQKDGLYEAILPQDGELKYGREYEFRVRFADLTGSSIVLKRFVASKQLTLNPTYLGAAVSSWVPLGAAAIPLQLPHS